MMAAKPPHIHEGKCGPCYLCRKESNKYIHLQKMDTGVSKLICDMEQLSLHSEACICHACYKQALRNVANPNFHPRWRPKQPPPKIVCGIVNCIEVAYRLTKIASPEKIETIVGQKLTPPSTASIGTPLCQDHYTCVHTSLHARQPCESCGCKPRWGERDHFRHCSTPEVINCYLNTISGEVSTLTTSSKICMSCYRFFNRITKQLAQAKSGHQSQNSNESPEEVCAILASQINSIKLQQGDQMSKTDYFEINLCYTAQNLAQVMAKNEVMLLPALHSLFKDYVINGMADCGHLHITNEEIPSTRWLISRLHSYFGDSILFECRHRYVGTMVFHKNCDPLKPLSAALGQLRQLRQVRDKRIEETTVAMDTGDKSAPSLDDNIKTVAHHLNKKLHEQAKHFISAFRNTERYTSLNISSLIKDTDPVLLQFIKQVTSTLKHESRRRLFDPEETEKEGAKTLKHFYILCILLFNANRVCSAPLHVMLTEAILCHGGNQVLVQIMNRIGAVASLDTCNRLATHVIQTRLIKGVKPSLVPNMLTIVSVDNIDILQSHAVVSTLDATRSWHGTSVQFMQPMPETDMLGQQELATTDVQQIAQCSDSPIAVLRSKRRRRTITEQCSPHTHMVMPSQIPPINYDDITYESSTNKPTIDNFLLTASEKATRKKLLEDIHFAMLLKHYNQSDGSSAFHLPSLSSLVHCLQNQASESECSNIVYVDILSEKADCKSTLLKVIGKVHKIFIKELNQKWVIVVGDAKVYDLLQAIRIEYGNNVKWLIPFPGDWHIMFNYHKVLMKPYADAGLMDLAKAAGYRAETLKSLRNANNFRRTHLFILQCFETFYHHFLSLFESHQASTESQQTSTESQQVSTEIHTLLRKFQRIKDDSTLEEFRQCVTPTILHQVNEHLDGFKKFLDNTALKQDTLKFWYNFLFEDCLPYLSLFIALRHRNWDMRTGSLKQLVAVYAAFDRKTYEALLPQHLHDLALLPDYLIEHFKNGSFAIRLSNTDWRGIALDECHEMKINKDAKLAVIRPSKEKMTSIANYLPFRAKCINNLKAQILPQDQKIASCYRATTRARATEENVKTMLTTLKAKNTYDEDLTNQGLWNIFEKKEATYEQAHDLLSFRSIGQEAFEHYVKYRLLKQVSTDAPVRMKKLCTFTTTAAQKKRIKQTEKERKISQRFLKRQLAWAAENKILPTNSMLGPISSFPRALMDKDGLPYKSSKSSITEYITRRYKHAPIILTRVPWIPTSVILEGMFMIQTTPLSTTETMKEYANVLLIRYVQPHYSAGVLVVHVIFDHPGGLPESPKTLEQSRRDSARAKDLASHECTSFTSTTSIPRNWRATLACRTCKSALIAYLGSEFLQLAPSFMSAHQPDQEFITNIKGTTKSADVDGEVITTPTFSSNVDEADMRIWLHCVHSHGNRVLIFSPDTDVYQIGLTQVQLMPGKKIIIQLSKSLTISPKLLDLNALVQALANDPDISNVPVSLRPQVLQSLYVCTGCDYISFFVGIGKCSFLSAFFQYASFITSGIQPLGSIGSISLNHSDHSLYSFLRLVGCAYFRLHVSAFEHTSPVSLYNSLGSTDDLWDTHTKWLALIRNGVWLRADSESQNMPTAEALRLHWFRCLWVLGLYKSSTENEVELPGI